MCSRHREHKTASYCSSQSNAMVTAFRLGRRRLVRSSNADSGFVFLEPHRRESHCQKRELSAALQTTSSASYSRDITMAAPVGSTDHPQFESCVQPGVSFIAFFSAFFFYSLFSVSNPPQPVRPNIRCTRRRLAAICAALILPTFFLRFMRTAAATAAGMRSGRMPPRCFRRRFRRGPQYITIVCPMEDTPLAFYTFSHNRTIKRFPRIFFPFA